MTKFVNKTPHAVTVFVPGEHVDGDEWTLGVTFPPEEPAVRVDTRTTAKTQTDTYAGGFEFKILLFKEELYPVENLPDPEEGTIFIVSRVVAEAARGVRKDFVYPTDLVRDPEGRVVGCKAFAFA